MNTEKRPVIGLSCYLEPITHGAWKQPAQFVPSNYVDGVLRAGGRPVLLPVDEVGATNPDEVLDGLDGLILIGGVDIDPASYGEERNPQTEPAQPLRDRFEYALALAAQERDLPLLGICRGIQIVNVAGGGSLQQHIPDATGYDNHRKVPGVLDERNAHGVRLKPGSLAARASGTENPRVLSHHHQAISRIARDWQVTGWASDTHDELPEALERPDKRFCLAVQWHPEGDESTRLFKALVEAARSEA